MTFKSTEEFFISQSVRCAARVYRPAGGEERRPVVVMGHGFGGVRALRLYAYAERFADAGYVVVVFDYRGFGESGGAPRQVLDVRMQLQDWRADCSSRGHCRVPTRNGSSPGAPRSAAATSSRSPAGGSRSPRSSPRSRTSAAPRPSAQPGCAPRSAWRRPRCATRLRRCSAAIPSTSTPSGCPEVPPS